MTHDSMLPGESGHSPLPERELSAHGRAAGGGAVLDQRVVAPVIREVVHLLFVAGQVHVVLA